MQKRTRSDANVEDFYELLRREKIRQQPSSPDRQSLIPLVEVESGQQSQQDSPQLQQDSPSRQLPPPRVYPHLPA